MAVNEFLCSFRDLASMLDIAPQSLQVQMKKLGIQPKIVSKKGYLLPQDVRKILEKRNFVYKKKIISVQMLKGGVGKSSTALNFGLRLNTLFGANILFVDLDQQANLSFSLGVDDPEGICFADVLEGTNINEVLVNISDGIDLLPSNLNNSVLDKILLNGKRNLGSAVSSHLSMLKKNYDFIIIDTAPNLSAINTAVSCASNLILLPVIPDKFSFSGLEKTIEDLKEIKKEFKTSFVWKVLFNRFDLRESSSADMLKYCFAHYDMLKGFVRVNSDIKNTICSGRTIFDKQSNAKEDFDVITKEIFSLEAGA